MNKYRTMTIEIKPLHNREENIKFSYGRKEHNPEISNLFAMMIYQALNTETESVDGYAEFNVTVKFISE